MEKEYKTISQYAVSEIEEKRSRFICSVKPVSSEEEALEFISSLKNKYWDATHNVYAYYIGGESVVQRFSDAGEPSGTAGRPMLNVIKQLRLINLVVVVTRYFGGTLLGSAGLIRAYGKSALSGIEKAGIDIMSLCIEVTASIDYSLIGKVQSLISSNNYSVKNVAYEHDVKIVFYVPLDDEDRFIKLLNEATNASVQVVFGKKGYVKTGH